MTAFQLTQTGAEVQSAINEQYDDLQKTNIIWDDLRAPATTIRRGATNKPDFDTTNMGLLFPQNNTAEVAYIIMQFPHGRKAGSDINPHIHFTQTSASEPVFKMSYRWYDPNASAVAAFTTLTSTGCTFVYTSGSIAQICEFPSIDGSSQVDVSSILEVKLYRDDNVVSGDVLVKEFDVHYQIDQLGSREEYTK